VKPLRRAGPGEPVPIEGASFLGEHTGKALRGSADMIMSVARQAAFQGETVAEECG